MGNFHTFVDYILITKRWEYGIAFAFMILFIFFYTFLKTPSPIKEKVVETVKRVAERIQGFLVPDNVYFHQGHAWAKMDSPEPAGQVASVGMDDFAQKLVGRIDGLKLPEVGARLQQGEKAWSLTVDSKEIEMLSPVEGEVVEVNKELLQSPEAINEDPYGKGWLLKVKSSKMLPSLRNLFSGKLAKDWTENVVDDLLSRANYDLGMVMGDGGLPIDGMAKSLDRDNWDRMIKEFFLTEE